jgi:hypothetical protein
MAGTYLLSALLVATLYYVIKNSERSYGKNKELVIERKYAIVVLIVFALPVVNVVFPLVALVALFLVAHEGDIKLKDNGSKLKQISDWLSKPL